MTERNGKVVRSVQVTDNDEAMLITDKGTLVRFKVSELSIIGRNTQGVRLINVSSGELVVGMQKIEDLGEEDPDGSEFNDLDLPSDISSDHLSELSSETDDNNEENL